MKRLVPPRCTSCESAAAQFQLDKWPTVILCFECIRRARGYLLLNGLANGNPFFYELTDAGERQTRIGKPILRVFGPSRHDKDPLTSTDWWIQVPHTMLPDSEEYFPTGLDLFDGL